MRNSFNSTFLLPVSRIALAAAIIYCTPARAQSPPSLEAQMREWEALPENPDMREVCSLHLRYSTKIAAFKNSGAPISPILRWVEQEAEKVAAGYASDPRQAIGMAMGTQEILSKLILQAYFGATVYEKVAGGFPQWAYRSCLKGRPIAQPD